MRCIPKDASLSREWMGIKTVASIPFPNSNRGWKIDQGFIPSQACRRISKVSLKFWIFSLYLYAFDSNLKNIFIVLRIVQHNLCLVSTAYIENATYKKTIFEKFETILITKFYKKFLIISWIRKKNIWLYHFTRWSSVTSFSRLRLF